MCNGLTANLLTYYTHPSHLTPHSVIGASLNGAIPLSENAGAIKLLDNTGFLDRFKISTNDDLRINGVGKGVIVNNGQYNYRISVNAAGQVVATIL